MALSMMHVAGVYEISRCMASQILDAGGGGLLGVVARCLACCMESCPSLHGVGKGWEQGQHFVGTCGASRGVVHELGIPW